MIDAFAKGYLHDGLRWVRDAMLCKLEHHDKIGAAAAAHRDGGRAGH